ncbi:MAG TPA: amidase [Anaerolineaceae bacterium]|nr:amidase [Anaerolineaceae bacterium]
MSAYDLRSVKLPRLTGLRLQLFTAAVSNPTTRGIMVGQLLKTGGVDQLRALVSETRPVLFPDHPADEISGKPLACSELDQLLGERTRPLPFKTVRDYASAYRSGKTTPTRVAQKTLDAVLASDKNNPSLRAFIAINPQDVLDQAEASTLRIAQGRPLSILDGVPIAVKDEVDMRPYPSTAGTSFLGQGPVEEDATVVARLRAAGALLFGKTNMHEIGINPNGLNIHYGPARNPFDLKRDPGGSSSGSAVAVAAGLVPVAIGADGGGSIRIPAALCGQVGLMSTFGRVSEKGAVPLCWSVGHLGPIGSCVEDVALVYAVIAGADPRDSLTLRQPKVTLDQWNNPDPSHFIIGIYPEWFDHADPQVVAVCREMLKNLVKAGAEIREVEIPNLDAIRVAQAVTILTEMATTLQNYPAHWKELADSVRLSLTLGQVVSALDYSRAQQVRAQAIEDFNRALEEVDIILTPATALTAPLIPSTGDDDWSDLSLTTEMMRFVFPPNLTGHPAISFPVGYDAQGLPVGMQAIGRPWEEHVLLRVASAVEQFVERRMPAVHYSILNEGN